MSQAHSFAVQYYLDHYSPPSDKVTFTWRSCQDDGEDVSRTIEWDPKILAIVSTFYQSTEILSESKTFEINHRQTIVNDNTAFLFHKLIPDPPGWKTGDRAHPNQLISAEDLDLVYDENIGQFTFSLNDIYDALDLCHFLGIEANDWLIHECIGDPTTMTTRGDVPDVLDLIPYHQIFLRLHYTAGIKACERLFVKKYSSKSTDVFWATCGSEEAHNETYLCMIQAYIAFSNKAGKLEPATKVFLQTRLGWKWHGNEVFGVRISFF